MKLSHRLGYQVLRLWWRVRRPVTLGVNVILLRGDEVLLVRTTYKRWWFLVGGGVESGETLEEAIRREAREEVGATMGALTLFGAFSGMVDGKSDHVVVFTCTDFELGEPLDGEIEERRFFALHELPEDISPGTARRLAELAAGGPPVAGRW